MQTFYSHGKLLLTAEYAILDGALGLALPTKMGQKMTVESLDENKLIWNSIDCNGKTWFKNEFSLSNFSFTNGNNQIAQRISNILNATRELNSSFLEGNQGYNVTTTLEFERDWGLGSSSTLINNIASWAKVDAFNLLNKTFGGSGYDIACAQHNKPLTYYLNENKPVVNTLSFNPKFSDALYFVHLNKKQNSREGIAHYKSNKNNLKAVTSKITAITKLITNCDSLVTFEGLIDRHEAIISNQINTPTVKTLYFKDYQGSIKSLGAWGGDFVLVTSKNNPSNYFTQKGFKTVIPYSEMILT